MWNETKEQSRILKNSNINNYLGKDGKTQMKTKETGEWFKKGENIEFLEWKKENALRWREQPTLLNPSKRSNKRLSEKVFCGMSGIDILSNMNIIHGEVRAKARLE